MFGKARAIHSELRTDVNSVSISSFMKRGGTGVRQRKKGKEKSPESIEEGGNTE